jgi:hypothetical protein
MCKLNLDDNLFLALILCKQQLQFWYLSDNFYLPRDLDEFMKERGHTLIKPTKMNHFHFSPRKL